MHSGRMTSYVDEAHEAPPQRPPDDIAELRTQNINEVPHAVHKNELDRSGVISDAIALGSKILDVTENLV